ncbi:hypothetical protein D0Z07_5190 [Hyphodiscus hymeniophilus]|uniref:MAU2 chromatid cohesion factor homolog n=1 Tax=Hyphodiscus hymeniophilus TaxID=353542 RepID=A0A9P6VHR8_9HELO|nr:hypothetical protein D0Z07_5190 [Hyphodiscus hymeniophilus]
MAYQGRGGGPPMLQNGYWPGHDPPNTNGYNNPPQVQRPRAPSDANGGHSQYQPPTPGSAYVGQGEYWNHYAQPYHSESRISSYPAVNVSHIQTPTHAPHIAPVRQQPPPQIPTQPRPQPLHQAQAQQTRSQAPTQTQAPQSQPQPEYISPAQLFHQPEHTHPQPLPQYMSPQQLFQAPRSTASNTSVRMAPVVTDVEIDIPNLLMSLAEEYFNAAHELAPSVASSMLPETLDAYQKLIATGLGCLETALKNAKLGPRIEASIRLRYAGVLYEETENSMEAETALSKGIALCERNHYFDIKYAMQYLLVRFLFKKSPKAGIKALDAHIANSTVYQHFSWVYALRFLRVSYCLDSDNPTDTHAAIQHLRAIGTLSGQQKDVAVYIAASLMEAMAHLKSNGPDSIEQAQRAIAAARTHQFEVDAQIPQLTGLTHILDVVCSIRQGSPKVMLDKIKEMQTTLDGSVKDSTWSSTDDVFAIPINRTKNNSAFVSPDTRMVLGIGADGRDNLMMSFLSKKDTFTITYLLCGMVLIHRNSADQKASKFFEQGLMSLQESIRSSRSQPGLLPDCVSKIQWRGRMLCYYHSSMAFCAAAVADWLGMKTNLDNLRAAANENGIKLAGPLEILALYLGGVYHQGVGDLDVALEIFQDPKLDVSYFESSDLSSAGQFMRDLSLLAGLNALWILQHVDRQDPDVNTKLVTKIEANCTRHSNRDIRTAFYLVLATVKVNPPAPLWKIKKDLGNALSGAQATANTQFLCITLNVMCSKFFANVVGDQAEKSAMAAAVQAKKSGNTLWRSVAEGMLAQYFDVNGKKEEAARAFEQAKEMAQIAMPD